MTKNSFILYTEYMENIEMLNMEQRGILLTALMSYQMQTDLPEMDAVTKMCFSFVKARIDRDNESYDEKCRKNAENGAKGGRPKKANGSSKKRTVSKKSERFFEKPKKADTDTDNEPDNDIKEKDISKDISKKKSAENVVSLYNSICTSLPKVIKITDSRVKTSNARIKDTGIDNIKTCFEKAQASSFLTGATGWQASYDWLMNSSNMAKVLEGNYDDKKRANSRAAPTKFSNFSQRRTDYDDLERKLIAQSMKG